MRERDSHRETEVIINKGHTDPLPSKGHLSVSRDIFLAVTMATKEKEGKLLLASSE